MPVGEGQMGQSGNQVPTRFSTEFQHFLFLHVSLIHSFILSLPLSVSKKM